MAHHQDVGVVMAERIAVYGGSFDPPHIAHVLVAGWALAMGEVDRVLMIPTYDHALGKEAGADFEERATMCELATASLRGVEVDRIEAERGGTSRTFETLTALAERHPGASFRLVIGSDILDETPRWYRWDEVATLAPPLVVQRMGYVRADDPRVPTMPEVSSTAVRGALATGDSVVSHWVPAAVLSYVRGRGLYGADEVPS